MEGVEVRVWNREIFKENSGGEETMSESEIGRRYIIYINQHERLLYYHWQWWRGVRQMVVRSFQGKGVFSIKLCVCSWLVPLVDVIYSKHAYRTCGPEDAICNRRCGTPSGRRQYNTVR